MSSEGNDRSESQKRAVSDAGRMDDAEAAFEEVAGILGGKWHLSILCRLFDRGPMRFNELKSDIDGISSKMLSDSLSALQAHDVVDRVMVDDKPIKVEYSLTERGNGLRDVVAAVVEWRATQQWDDDYE